MEDLKSMKKCLMAQAQSQMGNLKDVDAKELGEVIDMIKDLQEAIYYCTVTQAMNKQAKPTMMNHNEDMRYYQERRYPQTQQRFGDSNWNSRMTQINRDIHPMQIRDARQGKSPVTRKYYMQSKELNRDKTQRLQQLQHYMKELSQDITEMIAGATPEEKQTLKQKMSNLINMI